MKWILYIILIILCIYSFSLYPKELVDQIKVLDDIEYVDNNKYDLNYFKKVILEKGIFGYYKETLNVEKMNDAFDMDDVEKEKLTDINSDGETTVEDLKTLLKEYLGI